MIGLLIPAEGMPEAVEFEAWNTAAAVKYLANPKVLTWRDFRLPPGSRGLGRLFYDRAYRAPDSDRLLPRNGRATQLVHRQLVHRRLGAAAYVPRTALVLRTSKVGNRGARKLESLSTEDVFYLVAQLVLYEPRQVR